MALSCACGELNIHGGSVSLADNTGYGLRSPSVGECRVLDIQLTRNRRNRRISGSSPPARIRIKRPIRHQLTRPNQIGVIGIGQEGTLDIAVHPACVVGGGGATVEC